MAKRLLRKTIEKVWDLIPEISFRVSYTITFYKSIA